MLIDKTLSPDEFLGFFFIIFQIMAPIKELTTVTNRIQESTAAGKRIFEILDMDPYVKNAPDAVKIENFDQEFKFENVSFKYEEEQESENSTVLKNINLIVRKGEIVALVGA